MLPALLTADSLVLPGLLALRDGSKLRVAGVKAR
jgi:hypothetical protein